MHSYIHSSSRVLLANELTLSIDFLQTASMTSCKTLARVLLYFFNFIIFLISAVMVGLGVWASVRSDEFKKLLQDCSVQVGESDYYILHIAIYSCIGIGVHNFVTSCFGCCGAGLQSRCCLITYIIFCILSLLLLAASGALIVTFKLNDPATQQALLTYQILVYITLALAGFMMFPIIAASVVLHKTKYSYSMEENFEMN